MEEWRRKCRGTGRGSVNGEEVVAAAGFRRGGATATTWRLEAPAGGIVYAGLKMMRKKKAGGLPEKVMLAVTPEKLYAFKLKMGRGNKLGDEVAVWDRGGLGISAERGTGMTALTIESPAEGEQVTLVGVSIKDDPVSQELISVLQGGPAPGADVAIHRQRGGRYWYYWLMIVGGTATRRRLSARPTASGSAP